MRSVPVGAVRMPLRLAIASRLAGALAVRALRAILVGTLVAMLAALTVSAAVHLEAV